VQKRFSIVVPVYNRPGEMKELLESLDKQSCRDFEVIVLEDGSTQTSEEVVRSFQGVFPIEYTSKENSGPSDSRNQGIAMAKGEYVLFLDSDCIVPSGWLQSIANFLKLNPSVVFFGGPDAAHEDFTPFQKAVSYSMTAFLTTGGIRGGKKTVTRYYPRSFNMGVKREAALALNGFDTGMRFGEDLDFSMRLEKAGHASALISEAWVWHKRRTKVRSFFKQIFNSGMARVALHLRHPGSLKPTHLLPTAFFLGLMGAILLSPWCLWPLYFYGTYLLFVAIDAAWVFRNPLLGMMAVWATLIQHSAYGSGFLSGLWKAYVKKQMPGGAFKESFYK
jgi:glycosyltransferase involved in cell wall biosynthesis